MTGRQRKARLAGRELRCNGESHLSVRFFLPVLVVLGLLAQGLAVADAVAQSERNVRRVVVESDSSATTSRDSLLSEILRYSQIIGDLRDSLRTGWRGDIEIGPTERDRLHKSIGDVTAVIEAISRELSRLELEVSENRISLVDEDGEGIIITIPENLDEQLSAGFQVLSEVILAELPDTISFDSEQSFAWTKHWPVKPPVEQCRVVQGNVIKVWDDLYVPWGEEVRGNVVVVFGDCDIQGSVAGNVIVVGGNLHMADSAVVTGRVVAVGSRMDQDTGADLNDVFVIDPFGGSRGLSPSALIGEGPRGFIVCQVLFLLMLAVALVAAMVAPEHRFSNVLHTMTAVPAASFGVGLVAAVMAHFLALVLMVVLVLTVIGIPLALLVWLVLIVAGVIATSIAATALGERVCRRRDGGCPSRLAAVVVGMVLLHAASFAGSLLGLATGAGLLATLVSVLGAAIKLGAYIFGVGALTISRVGTSRKTSV